jgi:hypothetical protein
MKTDHFGYRPLDMKLAYCTQDPGKVLELRDAGTDALVLTTTAVADLGKDATQPLAYGDHVWRVDFSNLNKPGRYYLASPALRGQTYDFDVKEDAYRAPMAAALKALYYQRCGTPKDKEHGGLWHDSAACHKDDQRSKAACVSGKNYGILDLSGGWHDAGDFEKKIGSFKDCVGDDGGDEGQTLWYLLSAYELNPGLFPDGQSGIPESGNGIPDILDEAKWELDWYLKMQRSDQHVLAAVRVRNLAGFKSPPSADDNPRVYSPPTTRSEAIFVADLAHAARIFYAVPKLKDYSSKLARAALNTWNAHAIKAPSDDYKFWAASEIFRLYPQNAQARLIVESYKKWPTNWMNFFSVYDFGIYNYLQTPGAKADIVTGMKADLGTRVDDAFKTNDVYNSGMRDYYYSWNSNWAKMEHGMALAWSARLNATGSHGSQETLAHAQDYIHYIHGVNPMSMTYMTNTESMGAKHCIWRPWSMWFQGLDYSGKPARVRDPLYPYFSGTDNFGANDFASSRIGPPPGYVVDGPNRAYSGSSNPPLLAGAKFPPMAKVYRDYFDGKGKSWEMNEVGIYYCSVYVFLASQFVAPQNARAGI